MIEVKAIGRLENNLGKAIIKIRKESILLSDLISNVLELTNFAGQSKIGSELLIVVNGTAISDISNKLILSGDEVCLIPVTHGG